MAIQISRELSSMPYESAIKKQKHPKVGMARCYFIFCAGLPELGWQLFGVAHEESLDVPWILADQPHDDAAIQAPSRRIDEVARSPGPTIPDFRSRRGACLEGQFDPVPYPTQKQEFRSWSRITTSSASRRFS